MVIQATNISKNFVNTKALDNVSFSVPEASLTLLVGPNGAGKTTLLRIIAKELLPKTGEIKYLKENDSSYISVSDENREVFDNFTPLKYCTLWQLIYPQFDKNSFIESIRKRDIDIRKNVKHLSKGKKTWLFNALAVYSNSPVVLLDEPIQNLDPTVRDKFKEMLVKEKEKGRSILVSTHEITEFENITDKLLIICESHLLLEADKEKIFLTHRIIPGTDLDDDYETVGPIVNEKLVVTGKNIGRQPTLKEIVLGYLNGYSLKKNS
jgi:ABC-2 type transport system ATP-binding protein